MRFGRAMRVRSRADFEKAKAGGRRVVVGTLIMQERVREEGEGGDLPRLGLVVSRRVGNAVTRNLVKRRLRHLFRENAGAHPGAYDLVVVARPSAGREPFSSLQPAFEKGYQKLGRERSAR